MMYILLLQDLCLSIFLLYVGMPFEYVVFERNVMYVFSLEIFESRCLRSRSNALTFDGLRENYFTTDNT